MASSKWEIVGFAFIVTVWGLNYPASLTGIENSSPVWLAFFRAFTAFLTFSVVLLLLRTKVKLTRKQLLIGILGGIPGSALFFGLWFLGMLTVDPGIASVLVTAYPLWMLFMAVPVLGEQPSRVKVAAALSGFVGVALASDIIFQHSNNNIVADIELLISGLGFGMMNIVFKKYFRGKELLKANQLQLTGGFLVLGAWALLSEPFSLIKWNGAFIGSVLWLGVLGTAVAYTLWFILLSRYNASSMGVYMFMIIVVALVASFFLYGETINAVQFVGIAVIVISIYIVNRSDDNASKRRTPTPDSEGSMR